MLVYLVCDTEYDIESGNLYYHPLMGKLDKGDAMKVAENKFLKDAAQNAAYHPNLEWMWSTQNDRTFHLEYSYNTVIGGNRVGPYVGVVVIELEVN